MQYLTSVCVGEESFHRIILFENDLEIFTILINDILIWKPMISLLFEDSENVFTSWIKAGSQILKKKKEKKTIPKIQYKNKTEKIGRKRSKIGIKMMKFWINLNNVEIWVHFTIFSYFFTYLIKFTQFFLHISSEIIKIIQNFLIFTPIIDHKSCFNLFSVFFSVLFFKFSNFSSIHDLALIWTYNYIPHNRRKKKTPRSSTSVGIRVWRTNGLR